MQNLVTCTLIAQQVELNSKKIFLFCLLLFFFLSSQFIDAQCIVHTADLGNYNTAFIIGANEPQGQTFLACQDGEITSVSVGFRSGSQAGTYELYLAEDTGNHNPIPATAVASWVQSTSMSSDQILAFDLTIPFPVLNDGTLYRLVVTNTTGSFGILANLPSDYSEGNFVANQNNYSTTADLDFEVTIESISCSVHHADLGNYNTAFIIDANKPQGQTFLACQDGEVTSVLVGFRSGSQAGTYELYLAEDTGNHNPIPATAVASWVQSTSMSSDQILTFDLTIPFPVSNDGTLYRLVVTNTTGSFGILANLPSDYAEGNFVANQNNYSTGADLDFEIVTRLVSPNPEVPTLSEWGLLILALLLMTLGTLYLVQPNVRFEQEG